MSVRARVWLIAAPALAAGVAALAISSSQRAEYTGISWLVAGSLPLYEYLPGVPTPPPIEDRKITGVAAARTAERVGHGITPGTVRRAIDLQADPTTGTVAVVATARDARRSAALANAYAAEYVALRRKVEGALIRHRRHSLVRRMRERSRAPTEVRLLRARVRRLDAVAADPGARLASRAKVPSRPARPRHLRRLAVGLVIGGLLGLAATVAAGALRDRSSTTERTTVSRAADRTTG